MHVDHTDTLVAARKECPLIVGIGEDENFVASAIPAFLAETRERGACRERRAGHDHARRRRRSPTARATRSSASRTRSTWDEEAAEKGGYPTFMMKEIHEQPDAVAETITDRLPEPRRHRSLRRRARRRLPARHRPDRDRRLRHLVPRGPGRPLRDRAMGARPGGDGHRLRVPLPRPGPAGERPGHRHHPVGRDRRHARRDAPRPRGRRQGPCRHQHHGQPGDPRRGRRAVHARRPGDRRRRHQDLRQPGRGDVPAGAATRRAARRRCRPSGWRS